MLVKERHAALLGDMRRVQQSLAAAAVVGDMAPVPVVFCPDSQGIFLVRDGSAGYGLLSPSHTAIVGGVLAMLKTAEAYHTHMLSLAANFPTRI